MSEAHLNRNPLLDDIIAAIRGFPAPKDITGTRSWFGLVNQISWAYSNGPCMQPFRDLVKPNTTFKWDSTLDSLFKESKAKLIQQSIDGNKSFDLKKRTCLQTDFRRDVIGNLMFQKTANIR